MSLAMVVLAGRLRVRGIDETHDPIRRDRPLAPPPGDPRAVGEPGADVAEPRLPPERRLEWAGRVLLAEASDDFAGRIGDQQRAGTHPEGDPLESGLGVDPPAPGEPLFCPPVDPLAPGEVSAALGCPLLEDRSDPERGPEQVGVGDIPT